MAAEKITCKICKHNYVPKKQQAKFMAESREKGMKFVMLSCLRCGSGCSVQLVPDAPEHEPPYRCPVAGCYGWVSHVQETPRKSFWGCGECGSIWKTLAALEKEITAIVAKYAYRKKSYRKKAGNWLPADPTKEPSDYDERVLSEAADESESFERG
jgi:hypothetical protein